MNITVENVVAWLIAAVFLLGGGLNVVGSTKLREEFANWGYPPWFHRVNGVLQLVAAALIMIPAYRLWGLLFGGLVCVAAALTLVRAGAFKMLPPSLILIVVITVLATAQ